MIDKSWFKIKGIIGKACPLELNTKTKNDYWFPHLHLSKSTKNNNIKNDNGYKGKHQRNPF